MQTLRYSQNCGEKRVPFKIMAGETWQYFLSLKQGLGLSLKESLKRNSNNSLIQWSLFFLLIFQASII